MMVVFYDIFLKYDKGKVKVLNPDAYSDYIIKNSQKARELIFNSFRHLHDKDFIEIDCGKDKIKINNLGEIIKPVPKKANIENIKIKKEDLKNSINTIEGIGEKYDIKEPSFLKSVEILKDFFKDLEFNTIEKKSLEKLSLLAKIAKLMAFEEIDPIKEEIEKLKEGLKNIIKKVDFDTKKKIYDLIKEFDKIINDKKEIKEESKKENINEKEEINKKQEDKEDLKKAQVMTKIKSGDPKKDFETIFNEEIKSGKNKEQALSETYKKLKEMGYKVQNVNKQQNINKISIGDQVFYKNSWDIHSMEFGIVTHIDENNNKVVVSWENGICTEEDISNLVVDNFKKQCNFSLPKNNAIIKTANINKILSFIPFGFVKKEMELAEKNEIDRFIYDGKICKLCKKDDQMSLILEGKEVRLF